MLTDTASSINKFPGILAQSAAQDVYTVMWANKFRGLQRKDPGCTENCV